LKRALISVYDKKGIAEFAKKLVENSYEIVSTGGTAKHLKEKGLSVVEVSDITQTKEMLGGRVKTLHPKIFGGILAREKDSSEIEKLGINSIDMVVCNLYPFEEITRKKNVSMEIALENIDIGGVALLRAAAKNFEKVIVVSSISDYDWIIEEIQKQGLSDEQRLSLANKSFMRTAAYDITIANFLSHSLQNNFKLPQNIFVSLEKTTKLRYGENAHQKAALYRNILSEDIPAFKKYQGKELSYNNIIDTESAFLIANSFVEPSAAIIKHRNPCGIGKGKDDREAYERALSTDPMSAFGGIVALNRKLTKETAMEIVKSFKEVVVAPSFETEALEVFKKKKNLRVIAVEKLMKDYLDYRKTFAGWLIQEKDQYESNEEEWEVVSTEKPDEEVFSALRFAWKVVGFVKSNAIVIANHQKTIGIGAGQMSRIDAAELAVKKAKQAGLTVENTVLASDAFFPFRDSIDFAAKEGIKTVIEPGGSIRDKEVIQAANEKGIILVFTHRRHFRH